MDVYAENILDHYRHPRHKGALRAPSVTHMEINASCGDTLTIELTIEAGIATEIGWNGEGCAISQAGMSLLAEELTGKSTAELESFTKEDQYELLGVPVGPRRVKCALLCMHALKNALRKARNEEPQSWRTTLATPDA